MSESLHMTDNEVRNNFDAVLAKVRADLEIVVEQDHSPVAIIHSPTVTGRRISECIAIADARGSTVTLDEGFMKDVEDGIAERRQPWNPPTWE